MELKYINERVNEIILSSKPSNFRLYELSGLDGLSNNIYSEKNPNQDGISVINSDLQERSISIVGKIITTDINTRENLKRELFKVFNPKLNGTLYINNLCIDCIISNGPIFTKENYKVLKFMIELVAPDPYLKTIKEYKTEVAKWKNAFHFPLSFREEGEIIGYREPSLIANIYNEGYASSPLRVEFIARGNVERPSIIDVNTKEYIRINKNMVEGEKITITTGFNNKKVIREINGIKSNYFRYIDLYSTFLSLDPGDNLIKYDAEEGIDNLEVTIYHTPLYVGI